PDLDHQAGPPAGGAVWRPHRQQPAGRGDSGQQPDHLPARPVGQGGDELLVRVVVSVEVPRRLGLHHEQAVTHRAEPAGPEQQVGGDHKRTHATQCPASRTPAAYPGWAAGPVPVSASTAARARQLTPIGPSLPLRAGTERASTAPPAAPRAPGAAGSPRPARSALPYAARSEPRPASGAASGRSPTGTRQPAGGPRSWPQPPVPPPPYWRGGPV